MIVAASGHRSRTLGTDYAPAQLKLVEFAQKVLARSPPTRVISGMALGWDQAVARAATREGVPYTAVIPFLGQELRWHSTDRVAYRLLLDRADRVVVSGDALGDIRAALMHRNTVMVDMAEEVLALWDGRDHGGTFQCLKYAHDKRVRVHQLYQEWQSFTR